jgi:hypothetical protein
LQSKLSAGEVVADVSLPTRNQPQRTLLRVRVPDGWVVKGASAAGQPLTVDRNGTVDVTSLRGRVAIRFAVAKA